MLLRSAICYLMLLPMVSLAGEVLSSSVQHTNGHYSLSVTALIDAPLDTVFHSITDFDHLAAINPSIEESQLLGSPQPGTQRVLSIIKVCILMFCKRVEQVQDVVMHDGHVIEAVTLPMLSDFRSGFARWQLTPRGRETELLFTNRFQPDFWVPPIIGPWLIKRKLIREVAETAMYIELQQRDSEQK